MPPDVIWKCLRKKIKPADVKPDKISDDTWSGEVKYDIPLVLSVREGTYMNDNIIDNSFGLGIDVFILDSFVVGVVKSRKRAII